MLGPWLAGIMEFTVLEDRQVAGLVCLCVCGGWNLGSRARGANGRVCVCPTDQPTTLYPPETLALASARGFVRTRGFTAATREASSSCSPCRPHHTLPSQTARGRASPTARGRATRAGRHRGVGRW